MGRQRSESVFVTKPEVNDGIGGTAIDSQFVVTFVVGLCSLLRTHNGNIDCLQTIVTTIYHISTHIHRLCTESRAKDRQNETEG